MKVLHTADLHHDLLATRLSKWHLKDGKNLIYEERLERTRQIILRGIQEEVDVYVIAGDLFNRPKPFPQEYDDINNILDLIPEDKIGIIIPGNHDEFTSRGCALQPLKGRRQNIIVALSLEIVHVQGYDFILAPFGTPIEKIKEERAYLDERPILVFHGGTQIEGLKWTEVEAEKGDINVSDLKDLDCLAVMMGHYHGQTEIADYVWYSGSPEIYNFGEREQDKGFLIWTFTDHKVAFIDRKITSYPLYSVLSPEDFLASKMTRAGSFVCIQGEVTEEQRALILEHVKQINWDEYDYKLDLTSAIKEKKLTGIAGRSNRDILSNYFQNKQIEVDDDLFQLDQSLEAQIEKENT